MHRFIGFFAAASIAATLCSAAEAQPGHRETPEKSRDVRESSIVTHMMAFDTQGTGKLTKEMITDPRLHRLFDRADADKDGIVTKEELTALAARLEAEYPSGPGGPGGRRGPPQPGQVLPPFLAEMLELTDAQTKQLESLQKEVDGKLSRILTEQQKKRLQEMRERGPGGPRGPKEGPRGGPPKKDD